jgi:hypothetical protein
MIMQIHGVNPVAVVVAAVASYAVGLIIYGFLVPADTWMLWSGIDKVDMDAIGASRMPLSPVMPLMIAWGVSLAVKWRGVRGLAGGVSTGFLMALFFLVGGRLYGYVYGVQGLEILALDTAHLLLNGVAAGAVVGAWPQKE